ncbi:DUF551 domain-containing protein [Escherichia coli]|nr:DUF551 domain-containing protein [Escherichia coli]EFA2548301.1 DUF551 domain-containing protein [Escherichia coli]EFK5172595.1 DUF551 domain-containing protein [Escherichia coli]EJH4153441.1 DUF551 domain-containing protein [Escherichia coli]
MTTFTDKEMIKEIKERIGSLDARDNIERRAYEIALASLEAEPVAWRVTFTQIDREYNTFTGMYSDKAEVERWVRLHKACNFRADITPLYTAQPVPVTPDGWIPVSERMPEPYEYVLVTDGFDGCEVMRVNTDGYWGPAKSLYPGSITHWMPLPAAPQQEVK